MMMEIIYHELRSHNTIPITQDVVATKHGQKSRRHDGSVVTKEDTFMHGS